MHLKLLSKRAIQTTAEPTGDLFGNKIADNIMQVSKTLHRIFQKQMLREKKEIYMYKYIYIYIYISRNKTKNH